MPFRNTAPKPTMAHRMCRTRQSLYRPPLIVASTTILDLLEANRAMLRRTPGCGTDLCYNARHAGARRQLLGGVRGAPRRAPAARAAPRDPQGRRLARGARRRQGVKAAQLDEPAVHRARG